MIGATLKIIVAMVLCLAVESAFPYSWMRPDMVLLWLVPWSLRFGRDCGGALGFAGGLMLALLGGTPWALPAFAYGLSGYLLGWWGESEGWDVLQQILGVAFGVVIVGLSISLLGRVCPSTCQPTDAVLRQWMLQVLMLNLVLIWPVWLCFRRMTRHVSYHPVNWRLQ